MALIFAEPMLAALCLSQLDSVIVLNGSSVLALLDSARNRHAQFERRTEASASEPLLRPTAPVQPQGLPSIRNRVALSGSEDGTAGCCMIDFTSRDWLHSMDTCDYTVTYYLYKKTNIFSGGNQCA